MKKKICYSLGLIFSLGLGKVSAQNTQHQKSDIKSANHLKPGETSDPTKIGTWVSGRLAKTMRKKDFSYLKKDIPAGTRIYFQRVLSYQTAIPGGIPISFTKEPGKAIGIPSDYAIWDEKL